jgi:phage terminase small subunit
MLTPKQKAFSDYYIECGNASEAARRAGYSPETAEKIGSENLQKPEISAYIQERMAQQDASRVASADEVLRFYSSVMRGQEKDAFGLDPSLADRLKAADSLMKRYNAADDRQRSTMERLDKLFEEFHDAVNAETT